MEVNQSEGASKVIDDKVIRAVNSSSLEPASRVNIARQLAKTTKLENHLTNYSYAFLLQAMERDQLFVAMNGVDVIGCIGLRPISLRGLAPCYEVFTFYVKEEYRSDTSFPRISEFLFAHIVERADTLGVSMIFETTNPVAAAFCLEGLGFKCFCLNNNFMTDVISIHRLERLKVLWGLICNNLTKFLRNPKEYLSGMGNNSEYYAFVRFPSSSLKRKMVQSSVGI
ncbi:hypothetical protein ACFLY9_01415 [Patescibacteria group bacterium]